ncbi:hypothetical protein NQ659_07265 [Acinetobacter baumannii]|nr:hypothetical protein [Acinetobacter baumannii]MDC4953124.1 hypothetical protein [Acinetobacter baumannii]MDV7520451.1 hypothetical protein [Acinetobacter baumannii]HEN9589689.1 hypothetical protein [Acinetobacter baumannii]
MNFTFFISSVSIFFGIMSACAWLYASQVKISREKAVNLLKKRAQKNNEIPNLAGFSFDGWDLRETLNAQAKWNSIGAIFASISMLCQAILQIFF